MSMEQYWEIWTVYAKTMDSLWYSWQYAKISTDIPMVMVNMQTKA